MAIDHTFGGKLTWDIVPQSWETDTIATKLQNSIETAVEVSKDEAAMLEEYCVFLSLTRGIHPHINGTRPGATLVELIAVVNDWPRMSPVDVWNFRKRLPNTIAAAWRSAYIAGQELFILDPAQLPDEDLSAEQLEEVKDINSPLA